jgi:hypothetical protein
VIKKSSAARTEHSDGHLYSRGISQALDEGSARALFANFRFADRLGGKKELEGLPTPAKAEEDEKKEENAEEVTPTKKAVDIKMEVINSKAKIQKDHATTVQVLQKKLSFCASILVRCDPNSAFFPLALERCVKLAFLLEPDEVLVAIPDLQKQRIVGGNALMTEFSLVAAPPPGTGLQRTKSHEDMKQMLGTEPVEIIVQKDKDKGDKEKVSPRGAGSVAAAGGKPFSIIPQPPKITLAENLQKLMDTPTQDRVLNAMEVATREFAAAKRLAQIATDAAGKAHRDMTTSMKKKQEETMKRKQTAGAQRLELLMKYPQQFPSADTNVATMNDAAAELPNAKADIAYKIGLKDAAEILELKLEDEGAELTKKVGTLRAELDGLCKVNAVYGRTGKAVASLSNFDQELQDHLLPRMVKMLPPSVRIDGAGAGALNKLLWERGVDVVAAAGARRGPDSKGSQGNRYCGSHPFGTPVILFALAGSRVILFGEASKCHKPIPEGVVTVQPGDPTKSFFFEEAHGHVLTLKPGEVAYIPGGTFYGELVADDAAVLRVYGLPNGVKTQDFDLLLEEGVLDASEYVPLVREATAHYTPFLDSPDNGFMGYVVIYGICCEVV